MRVLQNISDRAQQFVHRVKEGMSEKEAELHQQYSSRTSPQREHRPSYSGGDVQVRKTPETPQSNAENSDLTQKLEDRIARDRALGEDFFA